MYHDTKDSKQERKKYGFLSGSAVKNLPAMQEIHETWVQSLGWEDSLGIGNGTRSRILAWKISWTEETGGLPVYGVAKSRTQLSTQPHHVITYYNTNM